MLFEKQQLRSEIKKKMQDFQDSGESEILCEKLRQESFWKEARHVMLYSPIKGEVNVLHLFDSSKHFYFPRMQGEYIEAYEVRSLEDLEVSQFGILEPKKECKKADLQALDLIIVPGLAFDFQGGRMGKGKGFYDRFLSQFSRAKEKPFFLSLAFRFQIVDQIPREEHDVLIDMVICHSCESRNLV